MPKVYKWIGKRSKKDFKVEKGVVSKGIFNAEKNVL